MKWGSKYGYEYVNRLYKSIKKHTNRSTQLYCFTDNSTNIDKDIICKPLPEISLPETISSTPWRKISLWQYAFIKWFRAKYLSLVKNDQMTKFTIDFHRSNAFNSSC